MWDGSRREQGLPIDAQHQAEVDFIRLEADALIDCETRISTETDKVLAKIGQNNIRFTFWQTLRES